MATEVAIAAVMWTISITLGVLGTIEAKQTMRFWALMVAMPAMLVTGRILMRNVARSERVCIERLVDGLVARARERADSADVPRIGRG